MKLPEGMKVYAGGQCYKGEMPDDKMPKGLKKKLEDRARPAAKPAKDK